MKTIAEMKTETGLALVVADHRGYITEVNERFTAIFGWSREEIVGKRLEMIIPAKLRDNHRLGFSRFLRTGRPTILGGAPLELRALAKDGHEFIARHTITGEQVDGNWMFAATIEQLGKP
jgi:PAS domain S-box-containing protein